jgi:hypothetical protein
MSHFTRIQTQIRQREGLLQALQDLHYSYQVGVNLPVRGWTGTGEKAEVVLDTGCDYDIGFVRRSEVYEAVADWDWGIERKTSIRRKSFIEQLNYRYAYNNVLAYAREENQIVDEVVVLENGDTRFVLVERA